MKRPDDVMTSVVDERPEEAFRRGSLFFGAALLGIQCGAWAISRSTDIASPPAITAVFAVVFGLTVLRIRHPLLRAAFALLAVQRLLALLPMIPAPAVPHWLAGVFTVAVATLLILAGARDRTRAILALAAVTFVVVLGLEIATTRYVRWVLGGRSVMGLHLMVS
jgi:hypothetical protein